MPPKLTSKPSELNEVQMILKKGILRKQGGQYKSWKDRWFTLTKEHLSYYKTQESEEPIKRIPIKEIKSCKNESGDDKLPSRYQFFFSVETELRQYMITARTETERNEWVTAISQLISGEKKDKVEEPAPAKEAETASISDKNQDVTPKAYTKKDGRPNKCVPLEHEFDITEYLNHFKAFVRNEKLSDVTFTIGNTSFPAHKAIVACRCPTLAEMYVKTSKVKIENMKPETFSSILDYIYTDHVELSYTNVVDIHWAAIQYKLTRLIQTCEVFIREQVKVENVLTLLVAANRLQEQDIERFLLGFMRDIERYTQVIKQPQATEIAQDNKDLYIRVSQVLAQPADAFNHSLGDVTIDPSRMTDDIFSLLRTQDYANVRIFTKEGELFCHKVVISARCQNFIDEGSLGVEEEQATNSKMQLLKYPTLDSQVVQLMLECFYGNKIKLEYLEDTYGLIELADRVQQESVVEVCDRMMRQNLTKETCLKILMVSSEYELLKLKKESLAMIVKESNSVLERKDLRIILSQWPWNLIDIIRALVKGEGGEYTDDEDQDNQLESDDEIENHHSEMS